MSSYRPHQNGLNFDVISQRECHNDNLKSLQFFTVNNPFRCHIAFILLFFFQIISTILMLISLSFTVEMVSAKDYIVDATTKHSGNIKNDFEEVLNRFRRLSEDKTLILTQDTANDVCLKPNYHKRFESLLKMRMSYCSMFEVTTTIYSFLYNHSDLVNIANFSFMTQETMISVNGSTISKIPSQLLVFNNSNDIFASVNSTQSLIFSHFSSPNDCMTVLTKMIRKDEMIRESVRSFRDTLIRQQCDSNLKSGKLKWRITCEACEVAYKNWLCTHEFDMYISKNLPNDAYMYISKNLPKDVNSALIGIKSCPVWCSRVETDCVYFTPADGNGGEPAFLCDESHYHQNARYRFTTKDECGADLTWKYCCYSQLLLDLWQNSSLTSDRSNCSSKQHKSITRFINSIYEAKRSISLTIQQKSLNKSKRALSLFSELNLIIFINSLFLYFYTYFLMMS